MRIIGYIEHVPNCKVTVFQQGMRFTIKFEDGLYEQAFKFRQSEEVNNLKDLQQLVDEVFIQKVQSRFNDMRKDMILLMDRHFGANEDDDFEAII